MHREMKSMVLISLLIPAIARNIFGNMACKKEIDCGENSCCAMTVRTGSSNGICMPAKKLGDRCAPTYIYGQGFACGCKRGLTCALVEINPISHHRKHRCVKVLPTVEELTENSKMNFTDTKGITASEIRKLLKKFEMKEIRMKKAT